MHNAFVHNAATRLRGRIRTVGVTLAAAVFVFNVASPAFAGTLGQSAPNFAKYPTALPPLRALAGESFQIGTAIGLPQLDTDPTYRALAAQQFNAVTPENAMKWDTTEPAQGVFNFAPADEIVAFAQANGDKVHGHTLVWHNQLPSWLTSQTWTAAQLWAILKQHIFAEVGHFRGEIWAWDVVNEAFNEDGTLRNTIWLQTLGPGYIAQAFEWAHEADPHAKLFINDYNIEGINAKSDAVYNLVKTLRSEGVPIDGVGIQGHLDIQYGFPTSMAANINRFHEIGVKTEVTELDVRMFVPATEDELAKQASYYSQVVAACTANPGGCVGVTVWGFTDKYSWVPSVFAGEGAADIYDENYAAKAAYYAVLAQLALRHGDHD